MRPVAWKEVTPVWEEGGTGGWEFCWWLGGWNPASVFSVEFTWLFLVLLCDPGPHVATESPSFLIGQWGY